MANIPSWDAVIKSMITALSQKSKDPRTKVGAMLVDPEYRIFVPGYNGFAPGVDDDPLVFNRETTWHGFSKDEIIIHAEMNAIFNCPGRPVGWTLYVTHDPCVRCAAHIHASGIGRVVTLGRKTTTEDYHATDRGIEYLRLRGVNVE